MANIREQPKYFTRATDLYGRPKQCRADFKAMALARCTTELARQVLKNEIKRAEVQVQAAYELGMLHKLEEM
jgi:hypothetical protein